MLYLLTGESGKGKTLWLAQLVAYGQQVGAQIDGFITPAAFENGEKVGIDCILLPSEEEFRLATRNDVLKTEPTTLASTQRRMCWVFDDKGINRVNQHLTAITPQTPSQELIVIDELGWLEFEDNQGFSEAMRILDQGCFEDAIAVIRPQLLEAAMMRWMSHNPIVMYPDGDVRGFFGR